jgi:hypothetical protein
MADATLIFETCVQSLGLSLYSNCGELFCLSEPQFTYLETGESKAMTLGVTMIRGDPVTDISCHRVCS